MRIQVAPKTPQFFAEVVQVVAKEPPFRDYKFGPMIGWIASQLRDGTNVVAIEEGKILGYLGWVRTSQQNAERWMHGEAGVPLPEAEADAVVVTVLVAPARKSISPMIRMLSDLNPKCDKFYRKRSFQDGRREIKRPPIIRRGSHDRDKP